MNDLELAPTTVVHQAARDFAAALAATPQFEAYDQAKQRLNADATARQVREAFQAKQKSLQALLQLNAVNPADRAELDRLQQAFEQNPAVIAFMRAEADLTIICQAATDLLTSHTGLNFSAACSRGCC